MMDYLDCKALSEVVETHEQLLAQLVAARVGMTVAGVDVPAVCSDKALARVAWSARVARRRFDRACDLYMTQISRNQWSGPGSSDPTTPPARAA